MSDIMDNAKILAKQMYDASKAESNKGCETLFYEWTQDNYWGLVVNDHINVFKKLHEFLVKNNHNKNNPFDYGDMDGSVWYEDQGKLKVVVHTSHCTCADDNTHIWTMNEIDTDWIQFYSGTAYPRQKQTASARTGRHKWNDMRDIINPSINTYRKEKFDWGYRDGRDKTHCFLLDTLHGTRVEHSAWTTKNLSWSLEVLRMTQGQTTFDQHI